MSSPILSSEFTAHPSHPSVSPLKTDDVMILLRDNDNITGIKFSEITTISFKNLTGDSLKVDLEIKFKTDPEILAITNVNFYKARKLLDLFENYLRHQCEEIFELTS